MTEQKQTPLVVDLDGTLIYSDLLVESFLRLIKHKPWLVFWVIAWILSGKAQLKRQIAKRVSIDVTTLPYNQSLIEQLQQEKAEGRKLVLASASDILLVQPVAEHLQLFDDILASDGITNLAGSRKRATLVERYGEQGFDYAGNAKPDLDVWRSARQAIVVSNDRELIHQAQAITNVPVTYSPPKPGIKDYVKGLRLHQWLKNSLILVPLLAGHLYTDSVNIFYSLMAFLAFGLCASSVYLLNDLLDLEDDRCHRTKCKRPFAAGRIALVQGILGAPVLLAFSAFLCLFLPSDFAIVLAIYYAMTTAYSFSLKRKVLVDVITLALLYTIRIIAGAAAIGILPSFWLLAFSLFVFHSLAMVKRYAELDALRRRNDGSSARGRGYEIEDLPLLGMLGGSSGYISVLVLALYINSPASSQLYSQPEVLWLLCPLMLYWVSRVWVLTHRGQMDDDPIVFAVKDRMSIVTAALMGGVVMMAA